MLYTILILVAVAVLILSGLGFYTRFTTLRQYAAMQDTHDLKNRLDQMTTDYVATRPQVALAVGIYQQGQTYVKGYGKVGAGAATPDGKTLFEIGSISKAFTGILLAQLAEEQVISLDDSLKQYLPSDVSLPHDIAALTLKQLATHTSGLPRLPTNLEATIQDQNNPYADYTVADLYTYLGQAKLEAQPDQAANYSNLGMGLLGHLLGLAADQPYATLIESRIATPLGMTDTTIFLFAEQQTRLASGHSANGNVVANWDLPTLAGAGALRSTVNDLLRFVTANLQPKVTPLAAALKQAQTIHFAQGKGGVGLGWQIEKTREGPLIHWHNGGTGGYVSYLAFDGEAQVGVVLLSNYGDAMNGDSSLDRMGRDLLLYARKISLE